MSPILPEFMSVFNMNVALLPAYVVYEYGSTQSSINGKTRGISIDIVVVVSTEDFE